MLTKIDLSKIKKVVEGSVRSVKTDTSALKIDFSDLKQHVSRLGKDMTGIKSGVKKIDKKVDKIIDFFDREHLSLEKRTKRVETHLHLPPLADF